MKGLAPLTQTTSHREKCMNFNEIITHAFMHYMDISFVEVQ